MQLEAVPGFVAYYPADEDSIALGLPCGDWAFLFDNQIVVSVSRRIHTPGASEGRYMLSALLRHEGRFLGTLPENPLWGIDRDEAIDWLFHIRILRPGGEPFEAMRFPIAHFLYKFSAIAESGWCLHEEMIAHGRKSLYGWCGVTDTFQMTPEADALGDIFGDTLIPMGIAEGLDPRYTGSPRAMIVTALQDQLASRNHMRHIANTTSANMRFGC